MGLFKLMKNVSIDESVIKRTQLGIMMLVAFALIIHIGDIALMALVTFLSVLGTFEIIFLICRKHDSWHINPALCYLIIINNFIYPLYPVICLVFPSIKRNLTIIDYKVLNYYIYCIVFMISIRSLRKRKLKSQLKLLFSIHIVPLIIGKTCKAGIQNIMFDIYFLVVPSLLVILNDIGAYFIGKFFGRHQIFKLSPNKTIEGFIGGAVCSLISSIFCAYLKDNYNFLPSKNDYVYRTKLIKYFNFGDISLIYFINFSLFIGSSIIAPFMGFLASAMKRRFKKKDFSALIPAHGGITDRFDCHIMIIWFTNYFLKSLSYFKLSQAKALSTYIIENFTRDEIKEIVNFVKIENN